MKKFNEWLIEKHPEILDEASLGDWARGAAKGGTLALALAGGVLAGGAGSAKGADIQQGNRPAAVQNQNQDKDVIERDGMVYIKGTVSPKDNSPKSMLDAMRVAETKIEMKAAKYFQSKGGRPGVVPPGHKEITNNSDVLSGKSDRIVWAWKIAQ